MNGVQWTNYAGSGGWWKRATVRQSGPVSGKQAIRWAWLQGDPGRRQERRDHGAAKGQGRPSRRGRGRRR